MCNITMKEEANNYPPEFIPISHPRIILILQLKYWAIPCQFVLNRFSVAKYKEDYEADYENYGEEKI